MEGIQFAECNRRDVASPGCFVMRTRGFPCYEVKCRACGSPDTFLGVFFAGGAGCVGGYRKSSPGTNDQLTSRLRLKEAKLQTSPLCGYRFPREGVARLDRNGGSCLKYGCLRSSVRKMRFKERPAVAEAILEARVQATQWLNTRTDPGCPITPVQWIQYRSSSS
jgi:hypothetical protein